MNEKREDVLTYSPPLRAGLGLHAPAFFHPFRMGKRFGVPKIPSDRGRSVLALLSLIFTALCALPLVAVFIAAVGDTQTISRLGTTLLPGYALTTLQIMLFVAVGTALIGAGAAWLVTACEFSGRRVLEITLVLPLAFPAYVLAYAYTDLLDHPGAVQTLLRSVFDWGPRDYWFPEIRSPGGAAIMLTLVLYPYVYLITRAALLMQGLTPFMVARSLGSSSTRAFFQISLPMVQPAILGGVLLALMETAADFGTVAHFGVQTLATGIYTTWFTLGDRTASAQMALGLLAIALLLLTLERYRKAGEAQLAQDANRGRHPRLRLTGAKAALAVTACALPVLLGAVIPVIMLVLLAFDSEQNWMSARYLGFASNSLILASTAAGFTVMIAVILSYNRRLSRGPLSRLAMAIGRMGYAVPGGVIAVGLFIPFAAFDNAVDAWARETLGISTGLIFSGSIALLVMAYAIRFLAAALGAWRAGEAIVTRDLDHAAQSMGASTFTILRRVHIPILTPAALTALLLVFVDTIKELPATLIMRPFGWDTLAVQAYRLAADERLEGAAVPSLVIVMIGLLPVILLCRRMGHKNR